MDRTVVAAAAAVTLLAACGLDPSEDDRPRTLEYITTAILKPSCAPAQCHSSFRQAANRAYDTVERACETMLERDGEVVKGEPQNSQLFKVLIRTIDRMPYDQPLPEVDQALIGDWISLGAPGLPATTAECP
jgi:hypothetical protein